MQHCTLYETLNIPEHHKIMPQPTWDCPKCHKQDLIRPFSLRNPSIREFEQIKKRNYFVKIFVCPPDFISIVKLNTGSINKIY